MPKKKSDQAKPKDEEFTFEVIQGLGGTKADLELLDDLDDDSDSFENKDDFETEPIKKVDIRSFMEDIGLADLRRSRKIKEQEEKEKEDAERQSKKTNIAVKPGMEDDEAEQADDEAETSKPEAKKKKGEKEDAKAKLSEPQETGIKQNETVKPETPEPKKKKKEKKKKNKKSIQDDEVSSTTPTPKKMKPGSLAFLNTYVPRKQPLIKLEGKWYDINFPNDQVVYEPPESADIKRIEEYAAKLLEEDVLLFKKQQERMRKSDTRWIQTVLKSGTVGDRMAALTIMIQESPIHNLVHLETFVQMMKKKGRREALTAIDTLKDLFLSDLLPDRKLKSFEQHPLGQVEELASGNKEMRDRRLLIWYFEHQLRAKYGSFVESLQSLSHDTITGSKKKAIAVIHELLCQKPEKEKALLAELVNKLGDPDRKVAANCSHLLTRLVGTHPNMKFVVVMEVERLLYRPNIASKAKYYAVCFLNQLLLSGKEKTLAARLVSIYFTFFKVYVKRGDVEGKMLSALLTGVNRAFPFAKTEVNSITDQIDTLFKLVHTVKFNTSIQALMLLYHVMDTSDKATERFYMALYKKLLDPDLKLSSKQTMFLNLLFKSLKKDTSERRTQAFMKRLLQICSHESVPFICASLILVNELVKQKPGLLRVDHVGEDSDDEEEHFVDAPEEDSNEDASKPDKDEEDETEKESTKTGPNLSSWIHRRNIGSGNKLSEYDPLARNPEFCRAETECIYELGRLAGHFHPTVALWSRTVLKGEKVFYDGDPLTDFTLIRFLDRFVYRNPKMKEGGKDAIMSAGKNRRSGRDLTPVNSEKYIELGEDKVPVDERFFYRYFSQEAAKKKAKKLDEEDSNASDVDDDEFDDYLDTFEKGLLEEGKKELDFAGEFKKKKSQKKKGSGEESESEEEDDEDEDLDLSDEEVDLGDMDDEFGDLMDDDESEMEDDHDPGFDEEGIDFSGDDEFEDGDVAFGEKSKPLQGKGKRSAADMLGGPAKRKKGASFGGSGGGMFASADDFAHLLEENMGSKIDMTGSEAFANKDKADTKQIQWEAKRDKWMRDEGHGKKPGFKKGPNFKGKSTNFKGKSKGGRKGRGRK